MGGVVVRGSGPPSFPFLFPVPSSVTFPTPPFLRVVVPRVHNPSPFYSPSNLKISDGTYFLSGLLPSLSLSTPSSPSPSAVVPLSERSDVVRKVDIRLVESPRYTDGPFRR